MEDGAFVPRRPRASLRRRLRRRAFRALPFLAWAAAAAAVLMLWNERARNSQVKGLADAATFVVAPPFDGRIQSLRVALGDKVASGQEVARLDDGLLALQLRRARHELERLHAELTREDALLRSSWHNELQRRDFQCAREVSRHARDHEAARLELLATRAELEETRIRHRGIRDELDRQKPLQASGILSGSIFCQLETEAEALGKRIEELAALLQAREGRLASARERLEGFLEAAEDGPGPVSSQLDPIRCRIREQEVALEEIQRQIEACTLTAPGDGIVSELLFRPGEFIRRGTPLLILVQPHALALTAYVPDQVWRTLGSAPLIQLEYPDRPGQLHEARLLGVTPNLVRVPDRLWADPRREEWALALRLHPRGDEVPGQAVRVHLRRR